MANNSETIILRAVQFEILRGWKNICGCAKKLKHVGGPRKNNKICGEGLDKT